MEAAREAVPSISDGPRALADSSSSDEGSERQYVIP